MLFCALDNSPQTDIARLLAAVLLLLTSFLGGVGGVRCHSCEHAQSNEACNANVVECSNRATHGCFTEVQHSSAGVSGKIYRKGCMDFEACQELQSTNSDDYCRQTPSKCTYCCRDDSNCNAYNAADSTLYHNSHVVTILTVMTCSFMININFRFDRFL